MSSDEEPRTHSLARTATLGRIQPVRLVVVDGPDQGKEVTVREGTAVIGTRAECELVLTDQAVSRRHLSVELLGARVRVKDLESKNGSKYLGARLTSADVPVGSSIELGATRVAILPGSLPKGALAERSELHGLLGRSVRMRKLFAEIERLAPSDAPVLIRGETGTGKEGIARAIHALSQRAAGPLRVFDCAAVQPELIQSALFGHVRGAFTGAVKDARGALEEADGGTLFLDEVAELPLDLQPALLRALETRSFSPVGDTRALKSDFRILAATHQDLEGLVKQGRFRKDLYFRLAAIVLDVPPLRERAEDVPLLAEHFAAQVAGEKVTLQPSSVACLTAYRWPGNVRELRNTIERLVTLGPQAPLPGAPAGGRTPDFHESREIALKAFEKSYLESVLDKHKGSATAAAREAGIARSYFYRLLEEHGLKGRGRS